MDRRPALDRSEGGYVRLVRGCHHHPFRRVNKTPKPALFFLKPEDRAAYKPDDWVHAECWPPRGMRPMRLNLRGDGGIAEDGPVARRAATTTNRADQSPPWVGETC